MPEALIGAIDQGTSSSRFLVFAAKNAELITYHQIEIHKQTPREDWVEQDPEELLNTVLECMDKTVQHLVEMGYDPSNVRSIGISNQRETTIVWDKLTGKPLYNAIVWCDNRTVATVDSLLAKVPGNNQNCLRSYCGLPVATYFSAVKLHWLLQNVPEVKSAVDEGRCLFGTVDSWLLWNLTGGRNGGLHLTDVTNASRTALMNIETLEWDPYLLRFFGIPKSILPEIRSSSEIYGYLTVNNRLKGVPVSGKQLMMRKYTSTHHQVPTAAWMDTWRPTGSITRSDVYEARPGKKYLWNWVLPALQYWAQVFSEHGLLTTVAYKLGKNKPAIYALEGSVAVAGAATRWLKDNLKIVQSADEVEPLAASVGDTGGVYFVPAFSGLYAPRWRTDARGVICGLTHYSTSAHIARATLEAVCFQTKDVLEAMNKDAGSDVISLQVDGGMASNNLLLQLQADILGIPIVRPSMCETTALGAATAAGMADGIDVWQIESESASALITDTFQPSISEEDRHARYAKWQEAVTRSLGWEPSTASNSDGRQRLNSSLPGTWFIVSTLAIWLLSSSERS